MAFLFPDISGLKGGSKTFARIILGVIILALIYFVTDSSKPLFSGLIPKTQTQKDSESDQEFLNNLKFDYKIVKVVDGDTLDIQRLDGEKVLNASSTMRVRLLGINAPESVDPRRPVECYGKESSLYMKNEADGKVAAIELDPSQSTYDKYGRLLAYVFIKNSGVQGDNMEMLNEVSVKNGYSYEYTFSDAYKYQELFKTLSAIAKNNYIGLWSINTCNGLKTPVANTKDN